LLARRWGSTPERLVHELTDEQFNAALEIEVKAQGQGFAITAMGVQAAVADLLASKGKAKAMKAYLKSIGADGSESGANTHSAEGAKLAGRISALLKRGELD
jgi:hypothetical protein